MLSAMRAAYLPIEFTDLEVEPIGCSVVVFRRMGRMSVWSAGDADHRRTQHFLVERISGLHFADDGAVSIFGGFDAFDGVVHVRIEFLAHGIDTDEALLRERLPKLFADQLETFAVAGIGGVVR